MQNRLGETDIKQDIQSFIAPNHPTELSLVDFGFDKEYIESTMKYIWTLHPLNPNNQTPNRPIIIYTDYDADGITGGAILWETLHLIGFRVFPYVPNRLSEGYGFSTVGLDKVKDKYDPSLIISVDHGIVAKNQVAYVTSKHNIPIIVTDHHNMQEDKFPTDAKSIFHIPALSGSGVAYYVAKEIFMYGQRQNNPKFIVDWQQLERLFLEDYVGLATIGTVADLVPLQGASRALVFHGLHNLTTTKRAGIKALKVVAGHIGKKVTTYEVGFLLAPRINASGRLTDALDSLRLLCTHDNVKASTFAQKLNSVNIERQNMVKLAVDEAICIVEKIKETEGSLPKILIIKQNIQTEGINATYWHEGIIGLIASKLCDKYYRPSIVLTRSENDNTIIYKASCRSISGFHMTKYLSSLQKSLIKFGGHEAAAGLSIESGQLDEFIQQSKLYADTHIPDDMLIRSVAVDCQLPLHMAGIELAEAINKLSPFGMGNSRPVFVSCGAVDAVQIFGKDRTHLRFRLVDGSMSIEILAFGQASEYERLLRLKTNQQVVYSLDINHWNGSTRIQGKYICII